VEEDMPPRRSRRKAAIEATARFGGQQNRRPRRQSVPVEPTRTPSVDVVSDKGEEEPGPEEKEEEEEDLDMKEEDGHSEGCEAKAANERQNEGEASTAPVPEKVQ
jgi:hypothetical protein